MEKSLGVRKGAWTEEEDNLLRACIQKYGKGEWHLVPQRAGLNRCRKSCRFRLLNYLNPNINREPFSEDEADMILRFHKLVGNRWSLIAERLPGRTANDVRNYWQSCLRKNAGSNEEHMEEKRGETVRAHIVIKPKPQRFSKNSTWLTRKPMFANDYEEKNGTAQPIPPREKEMGECSTQPPLVANSSQSEWTQWWQSLLDEIGDEEGKGAVLVSGQKGKLAVMGFWDEEPTNEDRGGFGETFLYV